MPIVDDVGRFRLNGIISEPLESREFRDILRINVIKYGKMQTIPMGLRYKCAVPVNKFERKTGRAHRGTSWLVENRSRFQSITPLLALNTLNVCSI